MKPNLTKADALDDLPEELQTYLKDDAFITGNVKTVISAEVVREDG